MQGFLFDQIQILLDYSNGSSSIVPVKYYSKWYLFNYYEEMTYQNLNCVIENYWTCQWELNLGLLLVTTFYRASRRCATAVFGDKGCLRPFCCLVAFITPHNLSKCNAALKQASLGVVEITHKIAGSRPVHQ